MLAAPTEVHSAVGAAAEQLVLRLLYQLIAILAATRIVVWLVRRVGQTDVSGEILAGLLLGPSCLGALWPEGMHALFPASTGPVFVGLAQIGLVLLMFQIGLEFELGAQLRESKRAIAWVSLGSLVLPLGAGLLCAPWFHAHLAEAAAGSPPPPLLGFTLFFAVAMSITAIPILGRIFMELGVSRTRVAALAIGSAAINDVAGWLLLGVISLLVEGSFAPAWIAWRLGGLTAYVAFVLLVLRPLGKKLLARHRERHGQLSLAAIGLLMLLLFSSAAITSNLGVFAIIGGFVIGAAFHEDRAFVEEWNARVAPTVTTLLLPIFFAYTGLRTDVSAFGSASEWLLCALVCALAFGTKILGAWAGAKLAGESARDAAALAVSMNTRALMELIVLNIGYDLGVLPKSMFTKLVMMAIASTFIATPLIRRLVRADAAPAQGR